MSLDDCGTAVVMIYGGGRREVTLMHKCDGGEAYMRPLLRKAVQYAKTHYNSGDILAVLMSEGEMYQVDESRLIDASREARVRHVYYVTYRWDSEMANKTYHVKSVHLGPEHYATAEQLVEYADRIPENAVQLV